MSKVNCEAVGKRRQASLRMARAELLRLFSFGTLSRNYKPVRCNYQYLSCILLFTDRAFSELKMPYDTVVVADFADLECEASEKSCRSLHNV